MDSLNQLIKSANNLVVFTGAGMSTESGLPDFRSANRGLWTRDQKQYLSSTNALNDHLQEFIEFYKKEFKESMNLSLIKGITFLLNGKKWGF